MAGGVQLADLRESNESDLPMKRARESNESDLPMKRVRESNESDLSTKESTKRSFKPIAVIHASSKGRRKTMEDEFVHLDHSNFWNLLAKEVVTTANLHHVTFTAIFDGHGGKDTASFVKLELPKQLKSILIDVTAKKGNVILERDLIKKCILLAFKRTDKLQQIKAKQEGWNDGCCAIVTMIINNEAYVANLGDSKAVLSRIKKEITAASATTCTTIPTAVDWNSNLSDKCKLNIHSYPCKCIKSPLSVINCLTTDHTPLLVSERQRVIDGGGFVENGRVNGILEVSRSFGDLNLKSIGVIAKPQISVFTLTDRDEMIFLACDGLWSRLNANESIEFIRDKLYCKLQHSHCQRKDCIAPECKWTPSSIVKQLINYAVDVRGVSDNVSVVMIKFL